MTTLANICAALLPLAYSAAVAFYALAFFRRDDVFQRWTRPSLITAISLHTLLIYARTMMYGHCLVYTPFEMMTLISFVVTLCYLIVELATGVRETGLFFISLALLLQTISAMFSSGLPTSDLVPWQTIVGLHISAALFGYTAFAMSAVYGGLYLMMHHQLKSSKFGTFYERLPSLQLLEKMSDNTAITGVIFLAVAVAIAVISLPDALPNFTYSDPKIIATLIILGIYVAALIAKFLIRIDGRCVVILSLIGFFGTILSMTVINLLLSGFHKFN